MATNKPRFRLTTYGKLNPGDLVWEPHWKQQGYGAGKVKQIVDLHDNVFRIIFDDNTNVMRNSSRKCFASW